MIREAGKRWRCVCAAAMLAGAVLMAETPCRAEEKADVRTIADLPHEVAKHGGGILTVGYVTIGAESDWRIACNRSIREAFSKENGYSLIMSDAQQKHEKQIKAVREFINQEVDYILISPFVESGWDAVLEEAKEAGIPVIAFDREFAPGSRGYLTTWLGSDFLLEGRKACAWLDAFLEETGYEGGLGIVHLQGTLNSSAQLGRSEALDEALAAHPDWVLLDRQSAEFTTAKGREVMVDMLDAYGDAIRVVYCENDNEAYGAIEAIEESGRRAGTDLAAGEILVLSFDATRRGLEYTMSGEIAADTECAPEYGPLLTQLISKLEEGEELPERLFVEEAQFSAAEAPASVTVGDTECAVTQVTQEVLDGRSY